MFFMATAAAFSQQFYPKLMVKEGILTVQHFGADTAAWEVIWINNSTETIFGAEFREPMKFGRKIAFELEGLPADVYFVHVSAQKLHGSATFYWPGVPKQNTPKQPKKSFWDNPTILNKKVSGHWRFGESGYSSIGFGTQYHKILPTERVTEEGPDHIGGLNMFIFMGNSPKDHAVEGMGCEGPWSSWGHLSFWWITDDIHWLTNFGHTFTIPGDFIVTTDSRLVENFTTGATVDYSQSFIGKGFSFANGKAFVRPLIGSWNAKVETFDDWEWDWVQKKMNGTLIGTEFAATIRNWVIGGRWLYYDDLDKVNVPYNADDDGGFFENRIGASGKVLGKHITFYYENAPKLSRFTLEWNFGFED